jgi:hypothetical protein
LQAIESYADTMHHAKICKMQISQNLNNIKTLQDSQNKRRKEFRYLGMIYN